MIEGNLVLQLRREGYSNDEISKILRDMKSLNPIKKIVNLPKIPPIEDSMLASKYEQKKIPPIEDSMLESKYENKKRYQK